MNFKWLLTKLELSCVRNIIPRSRKRLWNGYPVLNQEHQNHDPVGRHILVYFVYLMYGSTPPGGYLTLKRWHGKIWPPLRGLPGVADRATHLEGSPHLSCKRDQIKMRDHTDRRVTMPTWGPPPPCKQALKVSPAPFIQFQQFESILYHLSLTFTTW